MGCRLTGVHPPQVHLPQADGMVTGLHHEEAEEHKGGRSSAAASPGSEFNRRSRSKRSYEVGSRLQVRMADGAGDSVLEVRPSSPGLRRASGQGVRRDRALADRVCPALAQRENGVAGAAHRAAPLPPYSQNRSWLSPASGWPSAPCSPWLPSVQIVRAPVAGVLGGRVFMDFMVRGGVHRPGRPPFTDAARFHGA